MSSNNINYFQTTSLKGGSEDCRVCYMRWAKQHQLVPEHVDELFITIMKSAASIISRTRRRVIYHYNEIGIEQSRIVGLSPWCQIFGKQGDVHL